jgi:hypothetical protein
VIKENGGFDGRKQMRSACSDIIQGSATAKAVERERDGSKEFSEEA